jgi:hypothetical protein
MKANFLLKNVFATISERNKVNKEIKAIIVDVLMKEEE